MKEQRLPSKDHPLPVNSKALGPWFTTRDHQSTMSKGGVSGGLNKNVTCQMGGSKEKV